MYIYVCVDYNDLTVTSLDSCENFQGNHPQMTQESVDGCVGGSPVLAFAEGSLLTGAAVP